jgi:hypothetical protein
LTPPPKYATIRLHKGGAHEYSTLTDASNDCINVHYQAKTILVFTRHHRCLLRVFGSHETPAYRTVAKRIRLDVLDRPCRAHRVDIHGKRNLTKKGGCMDTQYNLLELVHDSSLPRTDRELRDMIRVIRSKSCYATWTWRTYKCGHRDHRHFVINAYGEPVEHLPEFFTNAPHCGNCEVAYLKENSIRCFRCGGIILDGGYVVLPCYHEDDSYPYPAYTNIIVRDGKLFPIACASRRTCMDGPELSGRWTTRGFRSMLHKTGLEPTILLTDYLGP